MDLDDRSARVQLQTRAGALPDRPDRSGAGGPGHGGSAGSAHRLGPYLRGLCLIAAGRPEEAHGALLHALNVDPGLTAARETLADLSRTLGRLTEEQSHLIALMRAEPDRPERHSRWAGPTRGPAAPTWRSRR